MYNLYKYVHYIIVSCGEYLLHLPLCSHHCLHNTAYAHNQMIESTVNRALSPSD